VILIPYERMAFMERPLEYFSRGYLSTTDTLRCAGNSCGRTSRLPAWATGMFNIPYLEPAAGSHSFAAAASVQA
jgi:hypothetical protein